MNFATRYALKEDSLEFTLSIYFDFIWQTNALRGMFGKQYVLQVLSKWPFSIVPRAATAFD